MSLADDAARVRFFGSMCASIIGYEHMPTTLHDDGSSSNNKHTTASAHTPTSSSTLKLRAAVHANTPYASEVFAAVSTSASLPLQLPSRHADTAAAAAAAATPPRDAFVWQQRSLFVPLLLIQQQQQQQQQQRRTDDDDDEQLSVTVQLTLLHSRSDGGDGHVATTTTVAQQRVDVASLRTRVHDDVCATVALPVTAAALRMRSHSDDDDDEHHCHHKPHEASSSSDDNTLAHTHNDNKDKDDDAAVVLRVLVVLRVFDLSSKARAAIEAVERLQHAHEQEHDDDDALTTTLHRRLQRHWPSLRRVCGSDDDATRCVCGSDAPYGCMPLNDLYRHYRLLHAWWCGGRVRHSDEVIHLLLHGGHNDNNDDEDAMQHDGSSNNNKMGERMSSPLLLQPPLAVQLYSWQRLTHVSLHRVMLGDDAAAPLLLTLSHCTHLQQLHADRNALGDATCARLCALFGARVHHHHLHTLSLTHNRIYETGAVQLLWLARRNACVTALRLDGNPCSSRVRERIARVCGEHARVWRDEDVYNATSPQYAYLQHRRSQHDNNDNDDDGARASGGDGGVLAVPRVVAQRALAVWSLLTAAPVGDVDVWTRNRTTAVLDAYVDTTAAPRRAAADAVLSSTQRSLIAPAARAPLLSEVARTAARAVAAVVASPLVCGAFADVLDASAHTRAQLRRLAHDAVLRTLLLTHTTAVPRRRRSNSSNDEYSSKRNTAAAVDDDDDDDDEAVATRQRWLDLAAVEDEQRYAVSFVRMLVLTMRALAFAYTHNNNDDDDDDDDNTRGDEVRAMWRTTAAMLRGVGRAHAACGVGAREYAVALRAWVVAVQTCCGVDVVPDESAAALLVVLVLAVRTAMGV